MERPDVPYEPNPTDVSPITTAGGVSLGEIRKRRRGIALIALGVVTVASIATASIAPRVLGHKPGHPTTMEQELEQAYTRVGIADIRNTGKIVLGISGDRRQIIDFSVTGELNPVAEEPHTPEFTTLPVTGRVNTPADGVEPAVITAVGGGLNMGIGALQESIGLSPFAGRTPVVETVDVFANNLGVVMDSRTAIQYMAAYYAGTLVLRGDEGRITSVGLTHEHIQAPVQISSEPADVVTPNAS